VARSYEPAACTHQGCAYLLIVKEHEYLYAYCRLDGGVLSRTEVTTMRAA